MDRDHWLADAASGAAKRVTGTSRLGFYDFCTNGSESAGVRGMPTIGLGPGVAADAHTPDESVSVRQVQQAERHLRAACHRRSREARTMPATTTELKDLYRSMVLIREAEETLLRLFSQNRMPGFIHSYIGEEATAVGVCAALRPDDYLTSTHRGHGHILAKGGDLRLFFAELYGKAAGYCKGKGGSMHVADLDLGILGANGVVGGGIPIAAGAALAAQLRGTDQVAVSFMGDGATDIGAFHESLNLAALWDVPVDVRGGEQRLRGLHRAARPPADRAGLRPGRRLRDARGDRRRQRRRSRFCGRPADAVEQGSRPGAGRPCSNA